MAKNAAQSRPLRLLALLATQPQEWFDAAAINVGVPSTTDKHASSYNVTALNGLIQTAEVERRGRPRAFQYRITALGLQELELLQASGCAVRPMARLSGAAALRYQHRSRHPTLNDRPVVIRTDAAATQAPTGLVRSVFDLGQLSGPELSQPTTTQGAGRA